MKVLEEPKILANYIKGWGIRLWDHTFLSYFKEHNYFKEFDALKDFKDPNLIVKKVFFCWNPKSQILHRSHIVHLLHYFCIHTLVIFLFYDKYFEYKL